MRSKMWIARVLVLAVVSALGCEDVTAPGLQKPPGGGGGPRDIAFVDQLKNKGWCVRAMATDGSNEATLVCPEPGEVYNWFPTWEPGGNAIAYQDAYERIHRIDIGSDGTVSNKRLLLGPTACGGDACRAPKWSPLGNEIAVFAIGDFGLDPGVFIVPAHGCDGGPCPTAVPIYVEPRTDPGSYVAGVAWSPDGSQLAVSVNRGSENRFVVIVNRDGTFVREHAFKAGDIDWERGPNPDRLIVTVNRAAGPEDPTVYDLYFLDVTTGVSELAVNEARRGTFSPDGTAIVYELSKRKGALVRLELATGATTVLRRGGMMADWR